MAEEVNFLELAALLKVTPNTVLERFGSSINASIFDASNIAGSLKQKGLIDFTAYYPGPNEIVVTEGGKMLIAEAEAKSAQPFDQLDEAILSQLSGGKRIPKDLQNSLNLRPKDLALRLYKLSKQGFMIYELKSGGIDLLLTETGFLKVGAHHPAEQKVTASPPQTAAASSLPEQTAMPGMSTVQESDALSSQQSRQGTSLTGSQQNPPNAGEPLKLYGKPLVKSSKMPLLITAIVLVIIIAYAFYQHLI